MCVCVCARSLSAWIECYMLRETLKHDNRRTSEQVRKIISIFLFLFLFNKEQNTFLEVSYCMHRYIWCEWIRIYIYNNTEPNRRNQWKARLSAIFSAGCPLAFAIPFVLIVFILSFCDWFFLKTYSICVCVRIVFNYGNFIIRLVSIRYLCNSTELHPIII